MSDSDNPTSTPDPTSTADPTSTPDAGPPVRPGAAFDPSAEQTVRAIRANYRQVAAQYDGPWADFLFGCSRELLVLAPPPDTGVIVELGCGPARLASWLTGAGRTVIGLDGSSDMLRRAPADIMRVLGDAHRLPLAGAALDALYAPFVLFHLPDLPRALAEIRRVVRPGGFAAALSWSQPDPHPAYEQWVAVVDAAGAPPDPSAQMPSHAVTSDPDRLTAAWRDAGFEEVTVTPQRYRWVPDAEQFVTHSAVIGSVARRLRLLPQATRAQVLGTARRRLADLPTDAFVESGTLLASRAR